MAGLLKMLLKADQQLIVPKLGKSLLKINECSISVGFDRLGIIFDYHLMPIASQVRNFMLSRRTQRVIL